MKLVIDVPDWAQERHIYIMAGIEMLAYKLYGQDTIHIKTVRCTQCGNCCRGLKPGMGLPLDEKGNCISLQLIGKVWECGEGVHRPFGCSIGLEQKGRLPGMECAVEYRVEIVS